MMRHASHPFNLRPVCEYESVTAGAENVDAFILSLISIRVWIGRAIVPVTIMRIPVRTRWLRRYSRAPCSLPHRDSDQRSKMSSKVWPRQQFDTTRTSDPTHCAKTLAPRGKFGLGTGQIAFSGSHDIDASQWGSLLTKS
jgi:hypothetical protein